MFALQYPQLWICMVDSKRVRKATLMQG